MASDGPVTASLSAYDDTCPLLHEHPDTDAETGQVARHVPLSRVQMAALCAARLVDPIAFTQIFPYVNQMLSDLHVVEDLSQIGFYSGLVESAFAIAQLCSIYQWAQISDIVGRRPVIMLGIVGISITSVMFGMSKSLAGVLIARCLAGLFSGNVAVIHSVLGEITDASNQAVAFPIYGLMWPLGSITGPLLGGTFSNPAQKFPRLFNTAFFQVYPYFLPCFLAAAVGGISALLVYFLLDETLPGKRRRKLAAAAKSYGAVLNSAPAEQNYSLRRLLSVPAILALSASGAALSFVATAFEVVFVLFCYSPIEAGGLAFSASQIGYSLAAAGAISALFQAALMPALLRRFDHVRMYNVCMALWPGAFVLLPLLSVVAARGGGDARSAPLVWAGVAVVLLVSRVATLAYSLSLILVKESAPSPACLGATNGLVQFAQCASRAVAPAFVSSAFAYSVDNNVLGGHAWVAVMVGICALGCAFRIRAPEGGEKQARAARG